MFFGLIPPFCASGSNGPDRPKEDRFLPGFTSASHRLVSIAIEEGNIIKNGAQQSGCKGKDKKMNNLNPNETANQQQRTGRRAATSQQKSQSFENKARATNTGGKRAWESFVNQREAGFESPNFAGGGGSSARRDGFGPKFDSREFAAGVKQAQSEAEARAAEARAKSAAFGHQTFGPNPVNDGGFGVGGFDSFADPGLMGGAPFGADAGSEPGWAPGAFGGPRGAGPSQSRAFLAEFGSADPAFGAQDREAESLVDAAAAPPGFRAQGFKRAREVKPAIYPTDELKARAVVYSHGLMAVSTLAMALGMGLAIEAEPWYSQLKNGGGTMVLSLSALCAVGIALLFWKVFENAQDSRFSALFMVLGALVGGTLATPVFYRWQPVYTELAGVAVFLMGAAALTAWALAKLVGYPGYAPIHFLICLVGSLAAAAALAGMGFAPAGQALICGFAAALCSTMGLWGAQKLIEDNDRSATAASGIIVAVLLAAAGAFIALVIAFFALFVLFAGQDENVYDDDDYDRRTGF